MIVIERLTEELTFYSADRVRVETPRNEDFLVRTIRGSQTGLVRPGEGESVDIVDGGRRVCSIHKEQVFWYGAAPK